MVDLIGREDFPVNRGGLCIKGASAAELLGHPERLTAPLVRDSREAPLRVASWDDALDRIAAAIIATQARHGRDAVGAFGGGGLTNEKAYQFGKFVRVGLRSSNIDYNGRFCMSSAVAAATRAFGIDRGLPFPFDDIPLADVVVLVGANPADTMPPAMRFFEEGRERGARHVVVDPRRTATAALAHTHLQPVPNTDLSLANGLLHIAIRENLVDEAYISTRTNGFDAVRRAVRAYWPDRVERTTGIAVPDLYDLVRSLAAAPAAMILSARGAEQHADGTDTAQAWINLALALGLPGRGPGSGWGTITGQGNGQGGREHGQKADQLPGYRSLRSPADRAHVAAVWGIDPDELPGPGVSAYELLDRMGTDARRARAAAQRVEPGRVGAERPPRRRALRRAGLPGRHRHLPVRDRAARRRRAAHHAVGRGGRHDDQPGGPGAAAPPRRRPAARGAQRPADLAGDRRPARSRAVLPDRAPGGLRRAAPGQRGRDRRLRRDHLRAAGGRRGAASGRARPRTTPARPGCSPTASPPRTGGRTSWRSARGWPASCPTRTTRTC